MATLNAREASVRPKSVRVNSAVVLVDCGSDSNYIAVLKVVRSWTGLELAEAKNLLSALPRTLKTGLTTEQAKRFLRELNAVGANARLVEPNK